SPPRPLDRSLVQAFGALEQTLADLTTAAQATSQEIRQLSRKVGELSSQGQADRLAYLEAFVRLTDSIDRLSHQEGIAVGATVDARNALLSAKQQLEQGVAAVREATGSHKTLPVGQDDAPSWLRDLSSSLTNLAWKNKAKLIGWIAVAAVSVWHAVE